MQTDITESRSRHSNQKHTTSLSSLTVTRYQVSYLSADIFLGAIRIVSVDVPRDGATDDVN